MRRAYANLPHGQVHYREAGAGAPLLLLHQTASSSAMYERAAPYLADTFRVVAMDTPNFGMSDPLPRRPTMVDYAQVAVGLLDELGIDRASVAGFHTGAHIALELAASHPDRVEKAVLVGVLPMKDEAEAAEWHAKIVKPWAPDWEGKFLQPNLELLQSYMDKEDGEALWIELTQRLVAGPNYWHAYEAVLGHDAFGAAGRVTVPTLYVNPTEDMLIEQTIALHAATPGAEYAELPGGSDVVMRNPQGFAETVKAFCA